eukprot:1647607-Amphidinium_carterae.1
MPASSMLTVACSENFVIRNTFLELNDDAQHANESRRRSVSDYCDCRRSRTLTIGSIKGLEAVLEGDSDTDTPDEENIAELDRSHSLTDESFICDAEEAIELDRPHSFTAESLGFGSTSSTVCWAGLYDETQADESQCGTDRSWQECYAMSHDTTCGDDKNQDSMKAIDSFVWVAVDTGAQPLVVNCPAH